MVPALWGSKRIAGMKFLIVDDSYDDRLVTRRYLNREFGHDIEVHQARDPQEALDILNRERVDCILLDLHYGDSTGHSLLQALKEKDGELPSAVVVMTGSGSEGAAVSSLKMGAHDYVTKNNLDSALLKKVVDYALNSYRLQQEFKARQEELERINQELSHKDKLKTNFVASASHELRTPVAAMLGLVDLLKESNLDSHQQQLVDDLAACSDSLLLTVDDIIDLARVEAGIMETRPYAFHLVEEIQESLRPLRVLARDKGLILASHIPDDFGPWRMGDRRRIRQIVNNLVGNAIKYTDQGRVDVRVEEAGDDQVLFSISDTGIGIASADQARIFEPFFQAEEDDGKKSSGLGLTTCVSLVKALNGELNLVSNLGKGSTFQFQIPLPQITPPAVKERARTKTGEALQKTDKQQSLKILLVEDNHIICNVLQAQLESRGYSVYVASDGVKALKLLNSETVDVILMDCQMPNMDGYEATTRIRQDLQLNLPIIALTADAFQSQRDRCLECGMNDILVKPVSAQELDDYLTNLKKSGPKE